MVQWKSFSTMVMAGSNTVHYRVPCVTANTASVLTQQKQQSIWDKPQTQCKLCAARAPSAAVLSVAQPSRTTESRHAQGRPSVGERSSSEAANQHAKYKRKKPNQNNWPDLAMDVPPQAHAPEGRRQSLQQVVSSQSNKLGSGGADGPGLPRAAERARASHSGSESFFPLVHAPKYLVDE